MKFCPKKLNLFTYIIYLSHSQISNLNSHEYNRQYNFAGNSKYLEFCFLESSGIKRTIIIASAKHNALALIYLSFKVVKNVVKMTLKSTALSA